jgi:hypothetical protein
LLSITSGLSIVARLRSSAVPQSPWYSILVVYGKVNEIGGADGTIERQLGRDRRWLRGIPSLDASVVWPTNPSALEAIDGKSPSQAAESQRKALCVSGHGPWNFRLHVRIVSRRVLCAHRRVVDGFVRGRDRVNRLWCGCHFVFNVHGIDHNIHVGLWLHRIHHTIRGPRSPFQRLEVVPSRVSSDPSKRHPH